MYNGTCEHLHLNFGSITGLPHLVKRECQKAPNGVDPWYQVGPMYGKTYCNHCGKKVINKYVD